MGLRSEKIADQVRDVLAGCLVANILDDPRVEGVAITHVAISKDLQIAKVYFRSYQLSMSLSETSIDAVTEGLKSCRGFFRTSLAKNLNMRKVPDLHFYFDKSIEQGERIEGLLTNV